MAGLNDSSLTRVQPVFTRLAQRSEASWLLRLLRLGSRAPLISLPSSTGRLLREPVFEYPSCAPEDLLRWMLTNPDRVDWSTLDSAGLATSTVAKRTKLRDGDTDTMREALARLQTRGRRPGRDQWHILEGETKVDCALFADNLTVFVEGKRTEPKLTERVSWLRERDQVVRNLDCLRVDPTRAANWLVLLVVEAGTTAEAAARLLDHGGERVAAALPHLPADVVADVWTHYAGFTTWQAIAGELA